MAEFALGLTKTAVEGTLSLVKSAVEEDSKLRSKVQNDLVFITGEFEVLRSFLRVANRERTASDEVALALVRQLRALAFDVEDCVELVLHLDTSSRWAWLRRAWHRLYWRAPPLPLDVAVAEIKQVKARVEDASQRNTRYNIILHGSDDNKSSKQPPPYAIAAAAAAAATYDDASSAAAFRVLRDAWEATGKWRTVCDLKQELLIAPGGEDDHDELQVISVWGAGGGADADPGTMASIFREAYCDPEIRERFQVRAWVKLAHPFDQDEFVKHLLAQFCATSHQANAEFTQGKLMRAKKAMLQQMRSQRYLVILEDVLTVAEWDVIRMYLPDSKNGSRILLSTPHLGIAHLCTGESEAYQVSDLGNFAAGQNQLLCAFSKKEKEKTPGGKFFCQLLRCHGVISVWGANDDERSNLIDILYMGIINGWLEEIEGVAHKSDHDVLYKGIRNKRRKFKGHTSWVDVPDPFNLKVFAQRLFLNFHSDDIQASKITEVGKKGEAGLIEWCRKFLSEEEVKTPYVVVINGVQSKDDWDLIQSTFFSSDTTRSKGCIIVITKEETVARHCAKDNTHLAFNAKDLKADPSISTLIKKGCWHYAVRGRKGRLFYDRRRDAREWANKFVNVGGNNLVEEDEVGFRLFTVMNRIVNYQKGALRHAYYGALFQQQIERRCSWVDIPDDRPFDLTDFSWRLLLDFYSDDPQAKEEAAVGLMGGTIFDPIEKCREFLRNKKCLVIINECSPEDWDLIKGTFFCEEHIQSIVIIGNMVPRLNPYIYGTTKAVQLNTQEQARLIAMEYRHIFSTKKRHQEAIKWVETRQPIGRDKELADIRFLVNVYNLGSVWGIPGVGKSTLVRTTFYEQILDSLGLTYESSPSMFRHPRYEAFAWVDVPSPFNLTEFAWRLLLDLYSDDPQAMETAIVRMLKEGRQIPILECCNILRAGKCLVVIDGLHSKQLWDLIKATFLVGELKRDTTIVVITIAEEVAMHCVENNKTRAINITRLEANASLSLMEKYYERPTNPGSKESKHIAGKCGGLPKVIASVGAYRKLWTLRSLSHNFMGTLATDPEFHGLRPLFFWMQSYFDACSDSIKPCIFYLSIFCAEKNIRWRRLLWRWIAEGYCRDTSDGRTWEDNGRNYISELVKLSIIQASATNSNVLFQINGFFHEYIISRPMEDNLVFALEEGCRLNSTRYGQHLTIRSSWDRRDRIVYESIDFSRLRSLTVFGKWESFFVCSQKVNMRLLRVLDLEDAEGVTNEDLEQIAKLLTRLKFLSLRGCKEITHLPSSMGGLRQLQTLDIRHTSIVTLPIFITKLQKLQYIRAGTTAEAWDWEGDIIVAAADGEGGMGSSAAAQAITNLPPQSAATPIEGGTDTTGWDLLLPAAATTPPTESVIGSTGPVLPAEAAGSSVSCSNMPQTLVSSLLSKLCRRGGGVAAPSVTIPADIGKLAVLHTLGVVKVNGHCSSKAIFQELKKLTQLRKLGVSGINKRNIHEFCKAISGHAHLRSLSVELDNNDGLDDNIPEPPKTIRTLKLYGHAHKLLVWVKHYQNLEKLHLTIEKPEDFRDLPEVSYNCEPRIRHLRIRLIQDGELTFGSCWTWAHVFEIQCSSLNIKFDDPDNRSLSVKVLKVHFSARSGSQSSSLQISGLSRLVYLKEVWLKGYTDAHKHVMQQQISQMKLEDWQKRPVLKLVQPQGRRQEGARRGQAPPMPYVMDY